MRTAPSWLAVRTSVTQAETMTKIMTVSKVKEGARTPTPKSHGADKTVAESTSLGAKRLAASNRAA